MKFHPSWPQVAVLALLLSAVIVAQVVAPGVVSAVISIASTVVGSLFVDLRREETPPAPVLSLVPKEGEKKDEGS